MHKKNLKLLEVYILNQTVTSDCGGYLAGFLGLIIIIILFPSSLGS